MNNNIREISEEDNPLFELLQYKIELEFISQSQNRILYDKFKKIILSEFRHISCDITKKKKNNKEEKGKEKTFYFKYQIKSKEIWLPNYSLSLTNDPNIRIKLLILKENEDKQKYVTSYLNELANSKNQGLAPYTRLFILNNQHYENYVQKVKKKLPLDKNEVGVIYSPLKESQFKYIYKYTLIQIIQTINDYGKKQYELSKSKEKDIKHLSKEKIYKRIEEGLLHHDFKYIFNLCNYIEYTLKWTEDELTIKEIIAIIYFYDDFYSTESDYVFCINKEAINLFEELCESYKKKKDYCKECQCILKTCIYYSYFIGNEHKCEKYVQKLLSSSKNTPYEFQVMILLQLIWLYKQRNNYRKQNLNNYLGITLCLNSNEENTSSINIFLNFLQKKFPIYDIYHKKIQNLEIFNDIHKKIIRKNWKNSLIQIEEMDEDGKVSLKELIKRKVEKGKKLYVSKYDKDLNIFNYNLIWFNIQECLYRNIIKYCNTNNEILFSLVYCMSYLQSLEGDLSKSQQNEIINQIHNSKILNANKKINLSLYKIPILIRITPICSNIKFDITRNEKLPKKKQLFLYNPWKKASTINFFWTKNSYQYINIELENILKVPITLNNIIILFERKKMDKESENSTKQSDSTNEDKKGEENQNKPDENFNKGKLPICFPTSVTIPPKEKVLVVEKIKMVDEVIFDIIGIKYDIFNFTTEQYIDWNGNGLYFSFENSLKDNYYSSISVSKKKTLINLTGIQIYKEIPQLEIINLNSIDIKYNNNKANDNLNIADDDIINLYEYQEYIFPFEFKNNGNYPIDEIFYNVYVYKKEDYKVSIHEESIKKKIDIGDTTKIEYKYIHKRSNCKIEFRFHLKSNKNDIENENEEEILKPYIFYFKRINTENLLNFEDPKIIPQVNNNKIEEICKIDKRLPYNYNYIYAFNKKIFSFSASNSRKNKISLIIKDDKDSIIKKDSIDDKYSKEVSFDLNMNTDLSKINIFWECANDILDLKGAMNILDIFPNLKNNLSERNYFQFSIDIDKKNGEGLGDEIDIFDIKYHIKNISDKKFNELKLYCYIYQNINDSEINLDDELFFEGSLFTTFSSVEPNQSMDNRIVIYFDKKYLNYSTTFLLIDPESSTVYMSPLNKELK